MLRAGLARRLPLLGGAAHGALAAAPAAAGARLGRRPRSADAAGDGEPAGPAGTAEVVRVAPPRQDMPSGEIATVLGYVDDEELIHRDNLVLV